MRSRIPTPALLIAGLTLAAALGGVAISRALGGGFGFGAVGVITFLAFPAMGLLVVRHQPKNPIGWLLLGIGLNVYLMFSAEDYAAFAVLRHPGALPAGEAATWIAGWIWIPFALMVILLLPMLFPNGRLLSGRWRIVLLSGFLFGLLAFVGNAFRSGSVSSNYPGLNNPLTLPSGWQPILANLVNVALPFAFVAIAGSIASVAVRYRRADGLQRRQLRWFLLAVVLAMVPFVLQGNVPGTYAMLAVTLFIPLLPISIAIAVLRYRLYDIDVVINRALVYGALAAFISAVYVAIVVGVGRLIGTGNRPNLALSIVATAVVAVAFQPVRERVQRFANRLVYGNRASPYEVMAGFADRMAGTLSVDDVLPKMAEAAARGVGAQAVRVTLFVPDGGERSSIWPSDAGGGPFARTLPVSYRGQPIGEIAMRESAGQPITPGERRLLADLAAQAGLVLHNVRLTAELQARLADLSEQAADLRASRQRIVMAQETERRRLGSEIRAGVQRELEETSDQLDEVERLLTDDGPGAAARLDALTGETQRTLDGLRELARGIFPPLLADKGIVAALQAHARKIATPASIDIASDLATIRFDPGVEAAVYFCCTEALRGVDGPATIHLAATDDALTFAIDGAAALDGRLEGLRDRVEALGGSLEEDKPGHVNGRVPARPMVAVG